MSVHCSSTVRGARAIAARTSPRLKRRATGRSASRAAGSTACRLTARFTRERAKRSSMRGTIPTVLTVMRRSGTANPAGSRNTATARSTASRLSRGSPIPMKTTLGGANPRCRATRAYWRTISDASRLRTRPSRPVSQNTQPRAHPTWLERHTVQRSLARRREAGWRMATVSTRLPSPSRTAKRTVPSASCATSAAGMSVSKRDRASAKRPRAGGSRTGRPASPATRARASTRAPPREAPREVAQAARSASVCPARCIAKRF